MKSRTLYVILPVLIVGIVTAYAAIILYASWPITFGNVDKAGVFGDSFGILTALFSGLAFAGLFVTILQQREDLDIQREDIDLTRAELKKQHATLRRQSFESTLFQMLRLQSDIVNTIDLTKTRKSIGIASTTSGRDCFVVFYERLKGIYTTVQKRNPELSESDRQTAAYEKFWEKHQTELGHYFRHLYRIFVFIQANSEFDDVAYSRIVRAQLSDQELLLLFYNCVNSRGIEKFLPIAEDFELFDNLPQDQIIDPAHLGLCREEAFGPTA